MAQTRPPRAKDLGTINDYDTVDEDNEDIHKPANNLQEVILHSHDQEANVTVKERDDIEDYDRKILTDKTGSKELDNNVNGRSETANGEANLEFDRESENLNTENETSHVSSNELNDGDNWSREDMNGAHVLSATSERLKCDGDGVLATSEQPKSNDEVFQPNSTLTEGCNHVLQKEQVISGEMVEIPVDEAEHVFSGLHTSRVPVVIITANSSKESRLDGFDVQRETKDSGFYEKLNNSAYNGSTEGVGDNNTTGYDLPLKKVEFRIGGEDDSLSESSRRSSIDEKSVRFSDARFFRRIRPITESKMKDSSDSESNSSPDVYEPPRHEKKSYDADRGFVKFSAQRKSPADFRRSYSADDDISSPETPYMRGSQNSLRPISYSDDSLRPTPTGSRRSSTVSNNGGMPGILKKSGSPSRLEVGSDRALDRDAHSPTTNMSEGLRRYRRRSQLSISSDIPVDVPLKHRQMENEIRNKDNLEFIKRRISLQTDIAPQREAPEHSSIAARRSLSSPGYADEADANNNSFFGKGRGYSDFRSSSPEIRGYNADYQTALRNVNVGTDNGKIHRNSSRESLGEKIVVQTELSDEEINSYLGNIQPYERPYGLPASPKNLQAFKGMQSGVAMTEKSGNLVSEMRLKQGFRSADDIREEEAIPEPYVPIRKQREKSERHTSNINQQSFQRMPDIPPPVRPTSIATSPEASVNGFNLSNLSLAGQRFAAHIRKDSIALFNNKLNGAGPSKLRRFSQASMAELEQLRRKHMDLSKNTPRRYTCVDCGEAFTQRSSLSRHRGIIHSKKQHVCAVCGRCYTFATNLSSHLKTHHQQPSQPNVMQQTSVGETLVSQAAPTLSSDITHTTYECSTTKPVTETSSSAVLQPTPASTSLCSDHVPATASSASIKRPGTVFLTQSIEKRPKIEGPVHELRPTLAILPNPLIPTDPYIAGVELYISYFKVSIAYYSALLATYKKVKDQLFDTRQNSQ